MIDTLLKGWRPSSLNQYKCYLNKWNTFCIEHNTNPLERNDTLALTFLRKLFKRGYKYSALNTARSALSIIFDTPLPSFGESPLTKRFMRAMYNLRPNLPKYHTTWDVSVVLKYLETLSPVRFLNLQQLSHKLVTLLALVTAQRLQTLHALNLDNCEITKTSAIFNIQQLLKHSNPLNKTSNNIIIQSFQPNKKICPLFHLKYYIKRTADLRKSGKLFLNHQQPHHPVSKETLSRWVKLTLTKAGINTKVYSAHSTRSAATSAAANSALDITTILKSASWTKASTFRKYYHRDTGKPSFGNTVLQTL